MFSLKSVFKLVLKSLKLVCTFRRKLHNTESKSPTATRSEEIPSQDSEPPVRPGDPSIKQTYFDSIDSVPEHDPLIKGTKPRRAALSLVVSGSVG